jgi:hypothetical protein
MAPFWMVFVFISIVVWFDTASCYSSIVINATLSPSIRALHFRLGAT